MSLLWLLFFTVMIIFFQGFIFKKLGARSLNYTRYFENSTVFEGSDVQLVEIIANNKVLPMPWIRVESKIDSSLRFAQQFNLDIKHMQFHKSMFSLMPFTLVKRRHTIKCIKRGSYRLVSAALTYGDLFGMYEQTKLSSFDTELLVFPKLLPLHTAGFPSHSFMGDTAVRRWLIDDPFLVSGVREYQNGDPLNRINWKMTAKTMTLQVRNHDYTSNPKLMIYLNVESEERLWDAVTDPDLIEEGISIAATIAHRAVSQGIEVGFKSNAVKSEQDDTPVIVSAGSGYDHLDSIFRALAKMLVKRSVTIYTLLENDILERTSNTDILLISAYTNERIRGQIETLRLMGNAVEELRLGIEAVPC